MMQSSTKINANAYVLIGGSSKRFGSPKWEAKLNGVRLIDHTWEICKIFESCTIVGKSKNNEIKYPFLEDKVDNVQSPINGIYTALSHSNNEWNFIISCDLPLMTSNSINKIWDNGNIESDAIVPIIKKQKHPLCAFYNRRINKIIKSQMDKGDLKVIKALELFNTSYLPIKSDDKNFFNMNTIKDLNEINYII
tara:strand:+ start:861 stop:1442 length:582 start_codon:yes stop_codon:yes gene_type:complete